MKRVQLAYLKARRGGAPEEILENMRRWIEGADYELKLAQQEAEAEMMQQQQAMMEQQAIQQQVMAPVQEQGGQPQAALAPSAQLLRPTGIPT